MKAGIAIDDWKLPIFERHLQQAGYSFDQGVKLTAGTLFITVETKSREALEAVVRAANEEARRSKLS